MFNFCKCVGVCVCMYVWNCICACIWSNDVCVSLHFCMNEYVCCIIMPFTFLFVRISMFIVLLCHLHFSFSLCNFSCVPCLHSVKVVKHSESLKVLYNSLIIIIIAVLRTLTGPWPSQPCCWVHCRKHSINSLLLLLLLPINSLLLLLLSPYLSFCPTALFAEVCQQQPHCGAKRECGEAAETPGNHCVFPAHRPAVCHQDLTPCEGLQTSCASSARTL